MPDGFLEMPTNSPFNLSVGPYYYKLENDNAIFGLAVETRHCNSAGNLHGGMINAIADIALGNNVGLQLAASDSTETKELMGKRKGGPIATVSMSTDFVGTAQVGDWVEVHVDVQRTGRNLAFANAYLQNGEARIARVSAIFKVLS